MDQCKFKQVILDKFRERLQTVKEYEDPITRYAVVVSWQMAMSTVLIHLLHCRIISPDVFMDICNEFENETDFRNAVWGQDDERTKEGNNND